jgi:hypothetical protein
VAILGPADPPALLFQGETITGPAKIDYNIDPLPVGQYRFQCTIHPPMTGILIAQAK